MQVPLNRREFLTNTAVTAAAACALPLLRGTAGASEKSGRPEPARPTVVAFTKSFQDWSIPEVCRRFKQIGLDGLDLTVRPGGHIAPERVTEELPKAARAAQEHGLVLGLLTTSITSADALAEKTFAAAAKAGVKRLKLGYYRYSKPVGTLARQMDEVRKQLADVVRLGERYDVRPCVHIHSGAYIPSHGTMLYSLIRDFSPEQIGAYVDMLHMTLEGGDDGWRQGLDLLAPWIALCSVKNFLFEKGERDKLGQQTWHTRLVPVSEGITPVPQFVGVLRQLEYQGPYSLHSEYKGRHSFRDMTTEECLAQTETDLTYLWRLFA